MNEAPYTRGKQPCQDFKPNDSCFTGSGNVHDCYGCRKGTVSFCTSCCRDHHEGGYETCVQSDGEATPQEEKIRSYIDPSDCSCSGTEPCPRCGAHIGCKCHPSGGEQGPQEDKA